MGIADFAVAGLDQRRDRLFVHGAERLAQQDREVLGRSRARGPRERLTWTGYLPILETVNLSDTENRWKTAGRK